MQNPERTGENVVRAELADVPTIDPVAEREVRDRIWSIADERDREQYVRNSNHNIVLAAVLNSPLPLVSDTTRTKLLDQFNRQHRPDLMARFDAVDVFVQTAAEVADMVKRNFDDVAARPSS